MSSSSSSIYTYTERRYESESSASDEDSDDGISIFERQTSKNKRKRMQISHYKKSALRRKSSTEKENYSDGNDNNSAEIDDLVSSDDDIEGKTCYRSPSCDNKGDGITSIALQAKQVVDSLVNEKFQAISKVVDSPSANTPHSKSNNNNNNDQKKIQNEVMKCRAILDKVRCTRSSTKQNDDDHEDDDNSGVQIDATDLAKARNKATSHSSLWNLPVVRTQSERLQSASVSGTTGGARESSQRHSGSARRSSAGGEGGGGRVISFTTRLNGQHTRKWQIGATDSFAAMKGKLREVYGLGAKVKVTMKDPNGDTVEDECTPQDIEMEQDDQMDVTILASQYDNAVAYVERVNTGATETSDMVKCVTRLNGKHEWKWKISSTETFAKMKGKLREVYGLGAKVKVTMKDPNGDTVEDECTPQDIEMEQGDMLDVTIAPSLYERAAACAEAFASKQKMNKNVASKPSGNYVSSVSSLIAAEQHGSLKQPSDSKGNETVTCQVVISSDLSVSGAEAAVSINANVNSTLRSIHEILILSSLTTTNSTSTSSSTASGDYFYSLNSSLSGKVDLDSTLFQLKAKAGNSENEDNYLVVHLRHTQNVNVDNSPMDVTVFDDTEGHLSDTALASVKVRPLQTCEKLMTMIANQCLKHLPTTSLVFLIPGTSTRPSVQLKPSLTYQELGVRAGAHIRIKIK